MMKKIDPSEEGPIFFIILEYVKCSIYLKRKKNRHAEIHFEKNRFSYFGLDHFIDLGLFPDGSNSWLSVTASI